MNRPRCSDHIFPMSDYEQHLHTFNNIGTFFMVAMNQSLCFPDAQLLRHSYTGASH